MTTVTPHMAAPYTPQHGSVPYSVLAFFKANPEEELSRADIALKFDVVRNNIDALLGQCFDHHLLRRHKVSKTGDHCVIAGPALRAYEPPPAQAASQRRPRVIATRATRAHLPLLDMARITVEAGVQQPAGRRPAMKGETKYDDLFAALHSVGLSAPVPLAYLAAIQKAAVSRHKHRGERFAVRRMNGAEARVWRVE